MADKFIAKRVFINSKTKQLSVTIPRKNLKKFDSSLKFGEELFVELRIFRKEKK